MRDKTTSLKRNKDEKRNHHKNEESKGVSGLLKSLMTN